MFYNKKKLNNIGGEKMKDKICKTCGQYCITVSDLTKGMCCNCYEQIREDIRQSDIESEHDYYNGDGLWQLLYKKKIAIKGVRRYTIAYILSIIGFNLRETL